MSKFIIFTRLPYINFWQILWKILCRWKNRNGQSSKHFSECWRLLFLCSHQMFFFYKILWKILNRWKRHDEEKSFYFSECRSVVFLCSCHTLNFKNITKNHLPLKATWWAEFRTHFRMSMCIIFMQLPYINFLKYYETCFTVGNVLMSRIQTTDQNVEDYYFYAAAIY